ncbi:MAG: hypothetical protein AAFX06_16390 [Planctomycetota bacterium]
MSDPSFVIRYATAPPPNDLVEATRGGADWATDESGAHWIRLREPNVIAKLSGEALRVDEQGRLFRFRSTIPNSQLPTLDWTPLGNELATELPLASFPEQIQHRPIDLAPIELELIAAHQSAHGSPRPAAAVLSTLDELLFWTERAAASRLSRLQWIMLADQALIQGDKLPPIRGEYFSRLERLMIPAGKWWTPDVPVGALLRLFDGDSATSESLLHVWLHDGSLASIPEQEFATLSRASLRTTIRNSTHH